MYQALYRKWRPQTFDDVIGQEHITETLKNQIKTGKLSHAYLFIGTRGTGKTTCAKILAKTVNCESPVDGNPCNKCKSCLGIDSGAVMDVVELDAASNNGVDNVRALRDEAVFSPAQVKKRVYIVDEVHMLSTSAFNALLKILEEPPAHLMFILATTELHKIPATILSRCQRYSFRRIDSGSIARRLSHVAGVEGLELTPDAASLLSRLADGSMRDALSLLDQCSGSRLIDIEQVYSAMGLAGNHRTVQLLEAAADKNSSLALKLFSALWMDGKNPSTLLDELSVLCRDILMTSVAPRGGEELLSGGYDSATLSALSARLTSGEIMRYLGVIEETLSALREAVNQRLLAELCLIQLCEPALSADIPSINARLSRLEAAVESGVTFSTAHPEKCAPTSAKADDLPPWDDPDEEVSVPVSPAEKPPVPAAPIPEKKESQPVPAPSATVSPAADSVWDEIISKLSGKIPMGNFSVISDPIQAGGVLSGSVLTVTAANKFALSMVDKAEITDRIREAGLAVTGSPITVRVVMASDSGPSPDNSKIAALSRFGNVKFE